MRKKLGALLLLAAVVACDKEESSMGGGNLHIDNYRIGRSVARDGTAQSETNTYSVGDRIYMSFVVKNGPSSAPVQLVFSSLPDKRKMAELEKTTSRKGFVSFELKDTRWPAGTYRVEYFLVEGPKRTSLGFHDFELAGPAPGSATPAVQP
jgi:hypothetical protein